MKKLNRMAKNKIPENQFKFSFGDDFLKHHAGQIVTDQNYAIIELVANCWDAGSTDVKISWPETGGKLSISDNGIGMTKNELLYRWGKFNYNRIVEQGGKDAKFPKNVPHGNRKVFGRNGVGRHAMFCFNNEYELKTYKDGEFTHIRVVKSISGEKPYDVNLIESKPISKSEHGTEISTLIDSDEVTLIDTTKLIELIGSRFISDPQFNVYVNKHSVAMTDLSHLTEDFSIDFNGSKINIKRIFGEKGKNTKQNGIAWWYNRRLVGVPNWGTFDTQIIDGRHPIAKRLLYIANADIIDQRNLKKDWSGFYITDEVIKLQNAVYEFVRDDLRNLLYETRKERRLQVYESNRMQLASLPSEAKENIVNFLEEVQSKCPTIGVQELETTVEVLAKMEKSRSGYALLEKIASFHPDEIDSLNQILEEWTIDDAKKVLSELRWRLELVSKLEKLLEDPKADELHDLQPLFEHGLWIFGPEFESISFISNRSLATVIKNLLNDTALANERKRPDFVILSNSSIGVYSCESFNEKHEPNDFSKIIIVELKRVGIPIDTKQKDQALLYARELRKSKKVSLNTPIVAYVLGSEIEPDANETFTEGSVNIIPCRYNIILAKAHSRTFNLIKKIEEVKSITYTSEMDEVFGSNQGVLFDQA
ncbi:hypothetical protein BCY91_12650 [Pelobium manganitolerans]|uniref:ATP-binding protein n=1 Tax=Pelobium manganitolerans TaxID=1842495 RepID=A0A419S1Z3_9SPHI|nr:ATP-binding protein [Pelobium manganitolerans]RKD12487.1 hypothetical protein BCY91_12650 [Pelobium manganitolerans]